MFVFFDGVNFCFVCFEVDCEVLVLVHVCLSWCICVRFVGMSSYPYADRYLVLCGLLSEGCDCVVIFVEL